MLDSSSLPGLSSSAQILGGGAGMIQHPPTEFPTTMMVRNLPSDLTISELVSLLNQEGFKGLYDYVHIAGDQGVRSKSYGFINFVAPVVAMKFKTVFTGKPIQGRDILRVAEVLYAKGHGFKQNITHRINLHGTKVFLFLSGDEVPLPRDSAMVQTVVEMNRPAQERLRALLSDKAEISDLHALRLELGLNDSELLTPTGASSKTILSTSELDSSSQQRSLFGPNPDLATLSAAVSGALTSLGALSSAEGETSGGAGGSGSNLHLFVFPIALAALGSEVDTLEKLVGHRMRWQIQAVISGSAFCESVEALLTRAIADSSVKVAALVSPGDVAAVAGDSAVLLEFVREELTRLDGVFTLSGDAAGLEELKTQIPKVAKIPNLFTFGTALRKLMPTVVSSTSVPSAVAAQSSSRLGGGAGSRQVMITKAIWPSFARNLEQGGMKPVLQNVPIGTKASIVDMNIHQAVLLLQVTHPNGTRSVGFLPMEFTDFSSTL